MLACLLSSSSSLPPAPLSLSRSDQPPHFDTCFALLVPPCSQARQDRLADFAQAVHFPEKLLFAFDNFHLEGRRMLLQAFLNELLFGVKRTIISLLTAQR